MDTADLLRDALEKSRTEAEGITLDLIARILIDTLGDDLPFLLDRIDVLS